MDFSDSGDGMDYRSSGQAPQGGGYDGAYGSGGNGGGQGAGGGGYPQQGISKVLHVRNLPPDVQSDELVSVVSQFGVVSYVVMLPKNQALVEMASVDQSIGLINYTKTSPIYVRGRQVLFSFSKSTEINRNLATRRRGEGQAHQGEHVLLLTIYNPMYPITVDVLHAILSPHGNVLRVVIFTKNGVQALVEFDSSEAAYNAKMALDGKDIYDGCCTLKIAFSKIDKLNVRANNDKTRDFTNPTLGMGPPPMDSYGQASFPAYGNPMSYGGGAGGAQQGAPGGMGGGAGGGAGQGAGGMGMGMGMGAAAGAGAGGGGGGGGGFQQYQPMANGEHCVLIVYNLDDQRMNVERLFNLFCLYGNVVKVKMLPNKAGTALVQMQDDIMAESACVNLNNLPLFGQVLSVQYSKHMYIADSRAEMSNPNPTTSKDYSQSNLNRFMRITPNTFKHIYRPSSTLHFSNAPPTATEDTFHTLFAQVGATSPHIIKFAPVPPNTPPEKERKVGWMEWPSLEEAGNALALANNQKLDDKFTLKLAFSKQSLSNNNNNNNNNNHAANNGATTTQAGAPAAAGSPVQGGDELDDLDAELAPENAPLPNLE